MLHLTQGFLLLICIKNYCYLYIHKQRNQQLDSSAHRTCCDHVTQSGGGAPKNIGSHTAPINLHMVHPQNRKIVRFIHRQYSRYITYTVTTPMKLLPSSQVNSFYTVCNFYYRISMYINRLTNRPNNTPKTARNLQFWATQAKAQFISSMKSYYSVWILWNADSGL